LRLPGGSPRNARLCPAGCQQRSAAVSSGPKPQLMPSAFMGKRSVASRVADRPVQLAEHRAAASRRPVGSAGLNLDARWFLLIVVSYMIGTAAALAPKINAASWADLAAGKDKVCGDSRHRDACVRRLQADETDALVTEAVVAAAGAAAVAAVAAVVAAGQSVPMASSSTTAKGSSPSLPHSSYVKAHGGSPADFSRS
jgi:hypothetical protein